MSLFFQVSLYRRKNKQESVGNTIFFYGAVGFAMAVVGAAWVRSALKGKGHMYVRRHNANSIT